MRRWGVRALLASLGADSSEVAESLKAAGVKGRRDHTCGCPIAVLLRLNEVPAVVDSMCIEWAGQSGVCSIQTPLYVQAFIDRFDDGQFPELDEEAA